MRTGPVCNISPEIPPGAEEYAKFTDSGVTASLSITPSSRQTMLKLSPAIGTPGIMTRGMKAALLRAIEWQETFKYHALPDAFIGYSVV